MTWTLNLALHRKIAARIRLSDPGMQQADGADEVSKTIDAHRLILYRNSAAVATLTWNLPLTIDGETLKSPGTPTSAVITDADIDSGTWTARLESLNGTYVATTASVGKSGTDVIVPKDIDDQIGISMSVDLGMDSDLSSGGTPPTPSGPIFFSAASPWNADIPPGATYYGPSDARTAGIRATTISGGSTVYAVNAQNYAINVFYAAPGGGTETIRVRDIFGGRYDFYVTVPWPSGTHPAMGTDGHLCIHDADGVTTHEFWYLRIVGGVWEASTYARVRKDGTGWNLFPDQLPGMIAPYHRNPAEATDGSGACRAVSVGLLGGLITQEDVAAGAIDHALALALPRAMIKRGPRVYPADMTASYYDGDESSVGDVAYSMRFALPQSLDIESLGFSAEWLMVADAFQRKGGYPVDVGGNGGRQVIIYSQYPGAFSFGTALRDRQGTDFPKIVSRLEFVDWA